MRDGRRRLLLYLIGGSIVLAYFLFFTWRSAGRYFDQDDMMNMYRAWIVPPGQAVLDNFKFWNSAYRPLGALFYKIGFSTAGFDPWPFRILCLADSVLNLGIAFWFFRLVSSSERVAALAVLFFAFHTRILEVWYRTATAYDLFCFTFLGLAACLYIAERRRGRFPGPWRIAAILALYICALDSKEMAVSLPVILLAWEVLFAGIEWRRWWLIGLMALIVLPFAWGKTHGDSLLLNNPYYTNQYTWTRFTESWAKFLGQISFHEVVTPAMAGPILAGMLALAVVSWLFTRSRVLLMGWLLLVVAALPVTFIPARGGYTLYISWAGWSLYLGALLVSLQDLLLRFLPRGRLALACLMFLIVGWRMGKMNLHDFRADDRHWLNDPEGWVNRLSLQMRALHATMPRGARLLYLDDEFGTNEWTPTFIVRLLYRDDTIVADRIKMMDTKPAGWDSYNYVFDCRNGVYTQLKP